MSNTQLLSDLRPTSEKEIQNKSEHLKKFKLTKKVFVHYGPKLMLLHKTQAKFNI